MVSKEREEDKKKKKKKSRAIYPEDKILKRSILMVCTIVWRNK